MSISIRLVLAVTISLISAGQYYFGWNNYNEAIKCLSQVPKYRIQVGYYTITKVCVIVGNFRPQKSPRVTGC